LRGREIPALKTQPDQSASQKKTVQQGSSKRKSATTEKRIGKYLQKGTLAPYCTKRSSAANTPAPHSFGTTERVVVNSSREKYENRMKVGSWDQ